MTKVLRFSEFTTINEGGHALGDIVRPIYGREVAVTLEKIAQTIFPILGLKGYDIDAAVLGSGGKKLPDMTHGDLDLAVATEALAAHFKTSLNKAIFLADDALIKAGYSTSKKVGTQIISLAFPIEGNKSLGYVQLDLMFSSSIDYSKFVYHSPDYRIAESKYNGAYRGIFLRSIISDCQKIVTKFNDDQQPIEIEQFALRVDTGVYRIAKSFAGANGHVLKTPKLLAEYDKLVSNIPEEIVAMFFSKDVKISDLSSFEKMWDIFQSSKFPYPSARENIIRTFKKRLIESKFPMPDELIKDYPHI